MYVYIMEIKGERYVKIGVAENPENRLRQLQTGIPFELGILVKFTYPDRDAAFRAEKHLHQVFCRFGMVREWFEREKELDLFIRTSQRQEAYNRVAPKIIKFATRSRAWGTRAFMRWSRDIDRRLKHGNADAR